ncbi:MAG: hypothetical protein LBT96_05455 [Campylobacteraceae bacterium]|jgi:hypothetical protein|nr:hypothetical protein [Campylobacteraceae bacterium]
MTAAVKYQIGTYSGIENVYFDVSEDKEYTITNKEIIDKAKKQLFKNTTPPAPMYYESFKIIEVKED